MSNSMGCTKVEHLSCGRKKSCEVSLPSVNIALTGYTIITPGTGNICPSCFAFPYLQWSSVVSQLKRTMRPDGPLPCKRANNTVDSLQITQVTEKQERYSSVWPLRSSLLSAVLFDGFEYKARLEKGYNLLA